MSPPWKKKRPPLMKKAKKVNQERTGKELWCSVKICSPADTCLPLRPRHSFPTWCLRCLYHRTETRVFTSTMWLWNMRLFFESGTTDPHLSVNQTRWNLLVFVFVCSQKKKKKKGQKYFQSDHWRKRLKTGLLFLKHLEVTPRKTEQTFHQHYLMSMRGWETNSKY